MFMEKFKSTLGNNTTKASEYWKCEGFMAVSVELGDATFWEHLLNWEECTPNMLAHFRSCTLKKDHTEIKQIIPQRSNSIKATTI